jgi:hypothetical protein
LKLALLTSPSFSLPLESNNAISNGSEDDGFRLALIAAGLYNLRK